VLDSPFAAFGTSKPALPYYLWWYFRPISALPRDDAGANYRAVAGLQSLLALTIYHCQAKDFAELKRGLGFDNSSAIGRAILAVFPTAEPDTPILPAVLRYNIVVGRGSLIAYIVMSGVTWLLCLALVVGSSSAVARRVKDATNFPTLDFCTKCEVQAEDRREASREDLAGFDSLGLKERVLAAGRMRVRLIHSSAA
jgi:hypothetical protein